MKSLSLLALAAIAPPAAVAAVVDHQVPFENRPVQGLPEKFLIQLGPEQTRWVTEDEKWALKMEGVNFFDITAEPDRGFSVKSHERIQVSFPSEVKHQTELAPLLEQLSKDNMRQNLVHFTSFHTRYYKSETGVQSATWLFEQVEEAIQDSGAAQHAVKVERFEHSWGQFSIIATIPGRTNKTVVIGAHQDSINLFLPSILPAPGADDDGSGTVTILEAFRVLLQSEAVQQGNAANTIEFHWYSAEEAGLLGSQAIFSDYSKTGRDIKAMLQQDMTGYVEGTTKAGEVESVGVITDFVDPGLTEFIKRVITGYCTIPFVLTQCGYACSDHASASRYGYPSAFVIESEFKRSNQRIHTTGDTVDLLSFDHMLQHARMTLAFAYELAFAEL
ncbi:leucine aminopeptidase 1 [Coccidioides immitis RS]|uniref:Leucine aminopeptidase 1 n=5 Tax=Coccidioides TaxID=5500 RepID=LAP1_COCPS|nr:leucine aminopeptidase 1 [Coccidioides immitis RS]E9DBV9.1 RecName: Full=Leucine aminopeptidase 1; AltName: Full=Leucyl aminopeptidase 1; Short=LAP1; Flags: Precursor [Coccidioides posadasii str. Silveira]KMM67775.1 peptidase [Coccidioides posadasii RMSCC 3488]KMU74864.1 peptidase [Coccidioides immitis RMSCC 3703]KMU83396.1 LAP2 [Coccidioides immitis H538.4]TPX24097.1 Leucine aminopeptidase 1 [Coccidioides immitis]EAS31262.3 leucine aminopeptidase 1 [Coccidioides immitis RS]